MKNTKLGDRIFRWLCRGAGISVVLALVYLFLIIGQMSLPALQHFGLKFWTSAEWNNWTQEFGVLSMLYGTLVTSLLALLIAVPFAFAVALFTVELAPSWVAAPLGLFVEMLASIPSLVYGMWGLFVLVPLIRDHIQGPLQEHLGFLFFLQGPRMGLGVLAASLVLVVMILPTISAMARSVFKTVPLNQKEAALALGATKFEVLWHSFVKPCRSGLFAASILGLGRALGETMAVTMVIGNRQEIKWSLFESGQTMASLLANQYAEADNALHLSSLTAVGLALFLVTLIVNFVARKMILKEGS